MPDPLNEGLRLRGDTSEECGPYARTMLHVQLRPFESDQLPLVESWFNDADSQRWLGGPRWPQQMLDLLKRPLGEFRGAVETGRYRWLAWEHDRAVGYIDCGTHDRWTTWEGGSSGRGVISTILVPAASITYVVDPALRRRGYCVAMITELMALSDLTHIELFGAGVEPENIGSVRGLLRAGFQVLDPMPDWEGIVYYAGFRSGRVDAMPGARD
jgi:RimJ/RimL family protein N-acetyltransferase